MSVAKRLYQALGPGAQAIVDRTRYGLDRLPRVDPRCASSAGRPAWLPSPYRACLVVSADFELAWAWRYVKDQSAPHELALARARQTRANMPKLLELFDTYGIPVTWATVGHLFLDRCARDEGRPHPGISRLPHFENEHWSYTQGDWFDADPCTEAELAPAWYAPDLIRAILSSRVKHEIGCHTFSHIDCTDANCPTEVIDGELAECQRLAAEWGRELKTFVFPGNLAGNFASLRRHGFSAYRWRSGYELDVPRQDSLGLWQIPGGLTWEMPERWPAGAWIAALRRCVDRALETNTVLHFWFHPSCDPVTVETVFPAVLDYVVAQRHDLWVTTMEGLVETMAGCFARDG